MSTQIIPSSTITGAPEITVSSSAQEEAAKVATAQFVYNRDVLFPQFAMFGIDLASMLAAARTTVSGNTYKWSEKDQCAVIVNNAETQRVKAIFDEKKQQPS